MDLKEYIKETLVQISEGVESAQEEVRNAGGYLNPAISANSRKTDQKHFGSVANGQNVFLVDFDVSVSVSEESGTEAKSKIKVANFIDLGAGGNSDHSHRVTNKISFKIPLALPVDAVTEEQFKENKKLSIERVKKRAAERASSNGRFLDI